MLNRRFHLPGLFAVLLALMAQLAAGASVPRIDPLTGAALCHAADPGGTPAKPPSHPPDCPICPLCVALHVASAALLPMIDSLPPPTLAVVGKTALPPPATAPPAPLRPASQPRAPPTFS